MGKYFKGNLEKRVIFLITTKAQNKEYDRSIREAQTLRNLKYGDLKDRRRFPNPKYRKY